MVVLRINEVSADGAAQYEQTTLGTPQETRVDQ
jgi:hypothetical protein